MAKAANKLNSLGIVLSTVLILVATSSIAVYLVNSLMRYL